MVMKILILIFFFEIKESKITRGHNYTLVLVLEINKKYLATDSGGNVSE